MFATHHHRGNANSVLQIYREALAVTQPDVAERLGAKKQTVQQVESTHSLGGLLKHALARGAHGKHLNPWQLPTGPDGYIRPDVVEYLQSFKQRKPVLNPQTLWLTEQQALEQFAGADRTPAHPDISGRIQHEQLQRLRDAAQVEIARHPDDERFFLFMVGGGEFLARRYEDGRVAFLESDVDKQPAAFRRWVDAALTPGTEVSAGNIGANAGRKSGKSAACH